MNGKWNVHFCQFFPSLLHSFQFLMVRHHPAFVMSSLSLILVCDTFHSNSTALLTETTTQIVGYIFAGARLSPLGGGVRTHAAHHPVASVSRASRSIYLDHPYSISTKGRDTTPVKLGEALEFSDLKFCQPFSDTVRDDMLQLCTRLGFSASPILTMRIPWVGASGLPIMLTRLLRAWTITGVLREYRIFESASLPHLHYLPSTTWGYGASSSFVTFLT